MSRKPPSAVRAAIRWLALGLVGCCLTGCIGPVRRSISRQAMRPYADLLVIPPDYGLEPEILQIPVRGGAVLAGWRFRAERSRATVVLSTGNAGNMQLHLPQVQGFIRRGIDVVLYDFRGFGLSGGRPDLFRLVDDGVAVVRQVRAQVQGPLVLFGPSLGSVVALGVAREAPDAIDGLILESAFYPREVAGERLSGLRRLFARWFAPRSLNPGRGCARMPQPMLFLHGSRDGLTPLDGAERLYESCRAGEAVRLLWVAEFAGHSPELLGAYPESYDNLLSGFLEGVIAGGRPEQFADRFGRSAGRLDQDDRADRALRRLRRLGRLARRYVAKPDWAEEQRLQGFGPGAWLDAAETLVPELPARGVVDRLDVWLALARALEADGHLQRARAAYRTVVEAPPIQPIPLRYYDAGWWIGDQDLREGAAARLAALATDAQERRRWYRLLAESRRASASRLGRVAAWVRRHHPQADVQLNPQPRARDASP